MTITEKKNVFELQLKAMSSRDTVACPGCNQQVMAAQVDPGCGCCCESRCLQMEHACGSCACVPSYRHADQQMVHGAPLWTRIASLFLPRSQSAAARY